MGDRGGTLQQLQRLRRNVQGHIRNSKLEPRVLSTCMITRRFAEPDDGQNTREINVELTILDQPYGINDSDNAEASADL